MSAGASDRLPLGRRVRLAAEIVFLFYGLPLAYVLGVRVPFVFGGLWVGAAVAVVVLLRDPRFDRNRLGWGVLRGTGFQPVFFSWRKKTRVENPCHGAAVSGWGLFVLACVLAVVGVWAWSPEQLFNLPRQRPGLWVLVVVLYPLLSVYPQELIWRTLFYHRYGPLFGRAGVTLWASSLAFSFVHVVMLNPLAVLVTLPGGLIFGRRYAKTGSTLATSIEHSLYGILVFTVGLGAYFVQGRVRP